MKKIFSALQIIGAIAILLSACGVKSTATITAPPMRTAAPPSAPIIETTLPMLSIWDELLQAAPYPHQFPLPESIHSAIDGIYTKIDSSPPQWWTCYRCADYRVMGGIWRI